MNEQLKKLTEEANEVDEEDGGKEEELIGYRLQIDRLTELIHEKTSEMDAQLNSLGVELNQSTEDRVGADEKDSKVDQDAKSQSDAGQIEEMLGINTNVDTERCDTPRPSDVDHIDQLLNNTRLRGVDHGIKQTPGHVENTGMVAERTKPFLKANAGIEKENFEDLLGAEWGHIVADRPSKGKATLETTVEAALLAAQIKLDVETERSDVLQLPNYNQAYGFEDQRKSEQTLGNTIKAGSSQIVQDHPSEEYSGGENDDEDPHTPEGSENDGPDQPDYTEPAQLREDIKNACSSWELLKIAESAGPSEVVDTSYPTSGAQAIDTSEPGQQPHETQDDDPNLPADGKHPVPVATIAEESEPRQMPQDVEEAIPESPTNAPPPQTDKATESSAANADDGWTVVGPKRKRKDTTQSENKPAQKPQDVGSSELANTEDPEPSYDGSSTASDSVASSCTVQDTGQDQPDVASPKLTYDDTASDSESTPQFTPDSPDSNASQALGVCNPSATHHGALSGGFPLDLLSSEPLPLTLRRYSEGAFPDYLRVLLGSDV